MTKGCRFNAHGRYEQHASLSSFTLLILNVYVLAVNLLPLIPNFRKYFPSDETTIFTIILSILMLGVGQFVSSKEFTSKAMRFHDCGKELSLIYDKVSILKFSAIEPTSSQINDLIVEYNLVISKYEGNHKGIDLAVFKANNVSEFPDIKNPKFFKISVVILSFIQVTLKYMVCIFVPPLLIALYILLVTDV